MARPRRGKRRRQHGADWRREFLITGEFPQTDANPFEVIEVVYSFEASRAAWESLRSSIMRTWHKPGCRPWGWWAFDAPRMPKGTFPGCTYDGKLPEPRRYLSGPGKPLHEALAYSPVQDFGLWEWYGDPNDPPTFETQYQYLERHGLLLPDEDEPLPEPHPHHERIEDAARWRKYSELVRA